MRRLPRWVEVARQVCQDIFSRLLNHRGGRRPTLSFRLRGRREAVVHSLRRHRWRGTEAGSAPRFGRHNWRGICCHFDRSRGAYRRSFRLWRLRRRSPYPRRPAWWWAWKRRLSAVGTPRGRCRTRSRSRMRRGSWPRTASRPRPGSPPSRLAALSAPSSIPGLCAVAGAFSAARPGRWRARCRRSVPIDEVVEASRIRCRTVRRTRADLLDGDGALSHLAQSCPMSC